MTGVRRLAAPLRLAAVRLGRRRSAALLMGLGVAAGAAMLAAVLAGSLVAQDRSVGFAVDELPASQRAARAVWFGLPGQSAEDRAALDRRARRALELVTEQRPTALVLFRESTIAGRFVGLGAVDGLARWVDLRSGRLPRTCQPERCEVVRLRGEGRIPNVPGLRLVEVGQATLKTPVLFGDFIAPSTTGRTRAALSPQLQRAARYHQPAPAPLVLADGVDQLVSSPVLDTAYRSYSWVVPLVRGTVRAWELDRFPADVARARSSLQARSIAFDLLAPVEELRRAGDAGRAAGRRLLLIGGEAAALLFAFAVLAAVSMRRDVEAARRRLTWYGARRWQLSTLVAVETGAVAVAGTAVGWAVGVAGGAVVAARAGAPPGEVLANSALSVLGLLVAVGVALAVAVVLFAALRLRPDVGGLSVSPLDVAALGALGVIAATLARGNLDQASLSRTEGTAAALVLLPGLVTFVCAVAFARLFGPVLLGLERVARGRAVSLRLAAVSLARHPGHAAVAIAFLVVSVGLALFAESYRTTLARGQAEQAGYAVPLDFVIREDLTRLVPVAEAVGADRLAELGADARVERVLRLGGNVSRSGGQTGITVLGLDPDVLPALHGWRDSFSGPTRNELARRLARGAGEPAGPVLPTDAKTLVVRARGRSITLVASVENRRGDFEHLELGESQPGRGGLLRAPIPAQARGGRVVALTLVPPRIQERGADAGQAFTGTLALGPLTVATSEGVRRTLTAYRDWIGVNGSEASSQEDGVTLRYTLSEQLATRFRPQQPSDAAPLPVLASPSVAAAAGEEGRLPLRVGGEQIVVRIAGVLSAFPGTRGDFVVADRALLATAVNAERPGAAVSDEVWIGTPTEARRLEVAAALRRPPYDVLSVTSRAALARSLRHDPLARGALLTLLAGAVVALALALVGILLGVVTDLRDQRRELLDLEAEGARPATLRRIVRLRSAVVAVAGLAGGVAAGALLSRLVVDLVAVTANAQAAELPLELALDWRVLALAVSLCGLLASILVVTVTRRA